MTVDASATMLTRTGKNVATSLVVRPAATRYAALLYVSCVLKANQRYLLSLDTDSSGATIYRQTLTGFTMTPYSHNCDGTRKTWVIDVGDSDVIWSNSGRILIGSSDLAEPVVLSNPLLEHVDSGVTTSSDYEPIDFDTYIITDGEPDHLVTTLQGVNNIYADTGDVSLDYYADATLTIEALEKRIAALESGS